MNVQLRKLHLFLWLFLGFQILLCYLMTPIPAYAHDCFDDPLNGADCMRTPGVRQTISVIISTAATISAVLVNSLGRTKVSGGPPVGEVDVDEILPEGQEGEPGIGSLPGFPPNLLGGQSDNPYTPFRTSEVCRVSGIPYYSINMAILELVVEDKIFTGPGFKPRLSIKLTYNSASPDRGMFGKGWRFSYESSITQEGRIVRLNKGSGQVLEYQVAAPANQQTPTPVEAVAPEGKLDRLMDYGSHWLLIEKDSRLRYRYDKKPGSRFSPLTAIEDPFNNVLRISYNTDGTIQAITDPAGRLTRFDYHPNRLCASLTLVDGRTASYLYTPDGRLSQAVDLQGFIANYEYNSDGLMQRMSVDRDQKVIAFTYKNSSQGKCINTVTDPAGNVTRYEFAGEKPTMVREIDPQGKTRAYHIQNGLTIKMVDIYGDIVQFNYERGLPVRIQDKDGAIRQMAYDTRGNLTRFTDPIGNIMVHTYDSLDHMISQTDPIGSNWRYEYVGDNMVRRIYPLGQVETFEYDTRGQMTSMIDNDGRKTVFQYDQFGNLESLSDPLGRTFRMDYDPSGLTTLSVTNPRGYTTHLEYDRNDRLTKVIHPDGKARTYRYNCCAAIETVDENGHSWRAHRDALMMMLEKSDPAGNQIFYEYDKSQRLVKITDAMQRTQTITYENAQRRQSVTNPAGQTVHYQFDPVRNLIGLEDERGKSAHFTYDVRSWPIKVVDALGQSLSLERDALGRIVKLTNGRSNEIRLVYNAQGQIIQKLYDSVEAVAYQYHSGGRLASFKDSNGVTSFEVDHIGQVRTLHYPDGLQLGLEYDENGNLSRLTYSSGLVVRYTYDARDRLARVDWNDHFVSCSYDGVGNLTGLVGSNDTNSVYSYIPNGKLSGVSFQKGTQIIAQIEYSYDAAGNIKGEAGTYPLEAAPAVTSLQVTYNDANQVASGGGNTYRYDADGNLTGISNGQWQAVYDPENRLVELTRNGQKINYQYNGLGQRVQVTTQAGVRRFCYDPFGRLILETDGQGKTLAQYIYAGMLLVARVNMGGENQFYHYDKTGNILALTDDRGEVAAAYAYDPFGAVVNRTGADQNNPFTYVGAFGVMDEGGGLFFMRNRYYDANSGRFIQKDPLGIMGGSLNLYEYVSNNPVIWMDPAGLDNVIRPIQLGGSYNPDPAGPVKWDWISLMYGGENLVVSMGCLLVAETLILGSLLDPTFFLSKPVAIPLGLTFSGIGSKSWVKGIRQISEGFQGKPVSENPAEIIRQSAFGSLPGVPAATYLGEGRFDRASWEINKDVVGTFIPEAQPVTVVIDVYEEAQGKPLIECDSMNEW